MKQRNVVELGAKGEAILNEGRKSTAKLTVQITPRDVLHPSGRPEPSGQDTEPPPGSSSP
jgi:hypothetical protein